MSLVVHGERVCCGVAHVGEPFEVVQMSETSKRRQRLSLGDRRRILDEQGGVCYWCGRRFGEWFLRRRGRELWVGIRATWDHKTPYCHSQDNGPDDFRAACHVCNALKSDGMFSTEAEVRLYVSELWREVSVPQVSPMREGVFDQESAQTVLQRTLPVGSVEPAEP